MTLKCRRWDGFLFGVGAVQCGVLECARAIDAHQVGTICAQRDILTYKVRTRLPRGCRPVEVLVTNIVVAFMQV
jgi:hypothetical protein